jgi:hypothetical protein
MLEAKIQRPWKFSAAAPAIGGGERTRKGDPSIGRPPRASFHPLPAKLGQEEQQLGLGMDRQPTLADRSEDVDDKKGRRQLGRSERRQWEWEEEEQRPTNN